MTSRLFHDVSEFKHCSYSILSQLVFPKNLSMQLDVSTDLPKDLQCWQRWQRIPSLEITGSHWASTWICWNDLAKLNDAHRHTNLWWIIAETEKRFTCQLATNIHWQRDIFLANQYLVAYNFADMTKWYFSGNLLKYYQYSNSNCLCSWHNAQPAVLIPQLELNAAPGDI